MKSILIFSHGELIGDGMMKLPLIKALPEVFPNSHVTWLTGRHPTIFETALKPLVEPYIHYVINHTQLGDSFSDIIQKKGKKLLTSFHPLFKKNPDFKFDVIIDTEHKILSTLMLKTIPHQKFIGASYNWMFSDRKPAKNYKKPDLLLNRLMDLLTVASGKEIRPVFSVDIPSYFMELAKTLLNPGLNVILAPGAGGRFKCWPLSNFIKLGQLLGEKGINPVYILGPAETEWQHEIQSQLPQAHFPLQNTLEKSVYLTIALAKLSNICVANDGGVGHILASSDTPILSMWGPTDPKKSTPNGKNVHVVTAQTFGKSSMDAIPVSYIFDRLISFLHIQ